MRLHLLILILACVSASAAEPTPPSAWKYSQTVTFTQPGFLKMALPPQTMNAARADLSDLRVFSPAGQETPFFIETPAPISAQIRAVKSVSTSIQGKSTQLLIETGVDQPIDAVLLDSPSRNFMKAATAEGSSDGANWRTLAASKPVFRLPNGASETTLHFPAEFRKYLRITLSDDRSEPIPFSSVRVQSRPPEKNPPRPLDARIAEREERPGETRILLNLGAANLHLSSIEIEASDEFFTRAVSVLVPGVRENEIVEEQIASGQISRIKLDETTASENRRIDVERQIPSQTITIAFRNDDSPPLTIKSITSHFRPHAAGIYVQNAGQYLLALGNPHAVPPEYDLSLIRADAAPLKVTDAQIGPLTPNPNYREPEVLPGIAETGAQIDLSHWKFRKQIQPGTQGIQQIQLDGETLSQAAPGFQDLRIIQNQIQLPYLLQRTGGSVEFAPAWTATNDTKRPTVSVWQITIPYEGLPLNRLTVQIQNPLFQRTVYLYELTDGTRGEDDRRLLAQTTWTRRPDQKITAFAIDLNGARPSNLLLLETDNGDNPPVTIQSMALAYPITKILFKTAGAPTLHLYFGNPEAAAPHYDLAIASAEILQAENHAANLGPLERLKPEGIKFTSRGTSLLFWIVLLAVVASLLVVISRLLPARQA